MRMIIMRMIMQSVLQQASEMPKYERIKQKVQ